MAERSIKFNGLQDRLSVLNEDLEHVYKTLGYESVDVITVNPPYNEVGGLVKPCRSRRFLCWY